MKSGTHPAQPAGPSVQRPFARWMPMADGGFFGLVAGYLLALWLNQNVWLEMRVNVDLIIPAAVVLGLILGGWLQNAPSWRWLLLLEGGWLISFLWAYGPHAGALAFLPAEELREGLLLDSFNIMAANVILVVVMVFGNAVRAWRFFR